MKMWVVHRKDGSEVQVGLLPHKEDGKFSFVNFTKEHICPCKFNTIEDAIKDMDNDPFVAYYIEIG